MSRPVTVYGLFDPRTDECRYIGSTVCRLNSRLQNHICHVRAYPHLVGSPKEVWIEALLAEGLRPYILPLDEADSVTRFDVEQAWIDLHRSEGAPLLNYQTRVMRALPWSHLRDRQPVKEAQ